MEGLAWWDPLWTISAVKFTQDMSEFLVALVQSRNWRSCSGILPGAIQSCFPAGNITQIPRGHRDGHALRIFVGLFLFLTQRWGN